MLNSILYGDGALLKESKTKSDSGKIAYNEKDIFACYLDNNDKVLRFYK